MILKSKVAIAMCIISVTISAKAKLTCQDYKNEAVRTVNGETLIDYSKVEERSFSFGDKTFRLARSYNKGKKDLCQLTIRHQISGTMSFDDVPDDRNFDITSRGDIIVTMAGTDNTPDSDSTDTVTSCIYRILPTANEETHPIALNTSRTGSSKEILDGSKTKWTFNKEGQPVANANCDMKFNTENGNNKNNCGLQINSCKNRLVIEFDTLVAKKSSTRDGRSLPDDESIIKFPGEGNTCKIQNKHILTYNATQGRLCESDEEKCVEKYKGKRPTGENPINKSNEEIYSALLQHCGHIPKSQYAFLLSPGQRNTGQPSNRFPGLFRNYSSGTN